MVTTYHVENAKSGRASCRKCKEKISQGSVRVGATSMRDDEYAMVRWFKLGCFHFKRAKITVDNYESVLGGLDALSDEDRNAVLAAVEAGGPARAAKKAKKASEGGALSIDDIRADNPVWQKYKKMSSALLKDYLRKNDCFLKGKKAELLERCFDGDMRGRLMRCPQCGQGKLDIVMASKEMSASNAGGQSNTAVCNGYFDEEMGYRVKCTFAVSVDSTDLVRKQWKSPEDPDSESDEEDENGGEGGDKMFPANEKVATAKEALKPLLKAALEHGLRLPVDELDRRVAVGTLAMEYATSGGIDLNAAWKALRKKYPNAEDDTKKKAAGPKAKVEANALIADLFALIGDLNHRAGKNVFKTRACKQVSNTIRGLDFEITLEHLKGKHAIFKKGPNKIAGLGKSSAENITELLNLRNSGSWDQNLDAISSIRALRVLLGELDE